MRSAPNALEWDALFGSHKINRLLESNVLRVIAQQVSLIHMDFQASHLRRTKTAFSLLKPNQLINTPKRANVETKLRSRKQNINS
jgi:hypothetical protein